MTRRANANLETSMQKSDAARWAAVSARDDTADGRFVYCVVTTGVYCRPSCASRLPRRENVAFHETCAKAEAAGFRPCKRCRPDEAVADAELRARITRACRTIEDAEVAPQLAALARDARLSPHHFHRVFKRIVGVTPKAYAEALRQRRAQAQLATQSSVTSALYEAGYSGSGRFYSSAVDILGMKPMTYKAGGHNERITFAVGGCSLGSILVAATAAGVCAILLGDDPAPLLRDLQDRFPRAELIGGDADFEATVAKVISFIDAPWGKLDLPLDIRGTAFQHRVWQALRAIPPGETWSYQDLAKAIGAPTSTRAVASACAANPLAVAVPCHRVVRTDGALSGYRWGLDRKRDLIAREKQRRG